MLLSSSGPVPWTQIRRRASTFDFVWKFSSTQRATRHVRSQQTSLDRLIDAFHYSRLCDMWLTDLDIVRCFRFKLVGAPFSPSLNRLFGNQYFKFNLKTTSLIIYFTPPLRLFTGGDALRPRMVLVRLVLLARPLGSPSTARSVANPPLRA